MSMNKAIILGRVGKDPETKFTSGGTAVSKFSVATSKKWKDKQGAMQEKTEWHNIIVWGAAAEKYVQPYVKKGAQILIEGELQTSTWETEAGTKMYRTEIIADHIELVGSKSDNNQQKDSHPADRKQSNSQTEAEAHFASDDIPF